MFRENYSTTGYHGTSEGAARSVQKEGFLVSRGQDHWLGEGVYFFESGISSGLENAKEWGKVEAWSPSSHRNTYEVYAVLEAPLIFRKLWDLTTADGLKFFESGRTTLRKRGVKPKNQRSGRIFDNAVIEFIAKQQDFDGLKAWFFIKLDAQSRKFKVQSGVQNVTVLCVRKPEECILLDQTKIAATGLVNRSDGFLA